MRLEDFIKENYEDFNNEEPSEKHFERFAQRLKENKRAKRKTFIIRITTVAAAALFAGLAVGLIFFGNEEKTATQICILSDEMRETQDYYKSILKDKTEYLESLLENIEPELREEIIPEIATIAEDSEIFCHNSDESIAIMMEYYTKKIEVIENISDMFQNKINNNLNS